MYICIVKCCTIRKVLKTVIRFWIWYSLIHYWYLKLSHIIPSSQVESSWSCRYHLSKVLYIVKSKSRRFCSNAPSDLVYYVTRRHEPKSPFLKYEINSISRHEVFIQSFLLIKHASCCCSIWENRRCQFKKQIFN